jgi:hypothetical protein
VVEIVHVMIFFSSLIADPHYLAPSSRFAGFLLGFQLTVMSAEIVVGHIADSGKLTEPLRVHRFERFRQAVKAEGVTADNARLQST